MSLKNLKSFWVALLIVFSLAYFQIATAATDTGPKIPEYSARLVDTTSWLSSQEVVDIRKRLDAIAGEGTLQIAILIVDSIQPLTIEEYSMKVAEKWKIGKKGADNGILVTIARTDKKMRIEVGYGLEGVIPDIIAKRIGSDKMAPFLSKKTNKPYEGIIVGIDELVKYAKGEIKAEETKPTETKSEGLTGIGFIDSLPTIAKVLVVILGIIAGIILFADSGGAWLAGLGVFPVAGFAIALLYGFGTAITVAAGIFFFALAIRFGISIGGGILTGGGNFGGGGASIDLDL